MSIYEKRAVVSEMIERAPIKIVVNTGHPGVVVPESHTGPEPLVLELGHGLEVPIPDLDIGEDGIGATLSFNRSPQWCFVPWGAVIVAAHDDVQVAWPQVEPTPPKSRPKLSVVR